MKPSVLVIDDERTFRIVSEEALTAEGFEVSTAATAEQARGAWQRGPYDVVILDRGLPDADGVELLDTLVRDARQRALDTTFIVATAHADVTGAILALKSGASDYLAKPLNLPDLIVTVKKALEAARLRTQVRQLSGRAQAELGDFVPGESPAMRRVLEMIDRVAQAPDTTVLIQGESGTGKERVADLVHKRTTSRNERPFIEINCASLPDTLLESELFGYERGAFTDARAQKRGLFELADGGTLLLDEIGEMPPTTQAKLLKVLEEMSFRRLGGTHDLRVDVRVIAATNRDLGAEVKRGAFRLDLFHRLDVFSIHLPPLRDRREDIMPLARHFLSLFSTRMRKSVFRFSAAAERILHGYDYPGNVRELKNLIERAMILANGEQIGAEHIVLSGPALSHTDTPRAFFTLDLDSSGRPPSLEMVEKNYVARVLEFTRGNRAHAGRLLGVSYPTISKKVTEYGLRDIKGDERE